MRKITVFLISIFILVEIESIAQSVGISDQDIVPDPSAALEIRTTLKGLLIPRLTQAERDAISAPATGLLIFQTDSAPGFYYFNGTGWISIGASNADSDTDPTNEIQVLSISNDTIYLTEGGYVKLPAVADNMGNHSANQNIRLNEFYLSSDGENEGIRVGTNGNVELSHNLTVNGTVNLADNSIQTSEIANNAITAGKLGSMGASADQFLRYNGTTWVPATISGGLTYLGTWNAATNNPFVSDATGSNSQYYIVTVAGSQNLGSGSISFGVGDWVIHNGTNWQKMNNSNDVTSVFGRTGTITAQANDYTWAQINKTTSSIDDLSNVQAAVPTAGNLLIGDGLLWNGTAISGDVTLNSSGHMSIQANSIDYTDLKNPTAGAPANTILNWNGTQWQERQITAIEGDGSITNEIQDLSLAGNVLSLSSDASTVSLVPYLDNTDNQNLSLASNTLSLTNDATPVDLSTYLDNTDAQTLSFTSPNLTISGGNSVDLSSLGGGADNQTLSLSGSNLSIEDGNSVSLAAFLDNTDDQDLTLTSNTLSLSGDATSVSLAPYIDNTDSQTLTFLNPTLSISGGNSANLSSLSDNLGNHTASQNIVTNNFWLSNDGANNGLFIDADGHVGIGLNEPKTPLHVRSSLDTQVYLENNSANPSSILLIGMAGVATPAPGQNFITFTNSSGNPVGNIEGNGLGGVFYSSISDKRLKNNIVTTHFGLSDLMKIQVCDYRMNSSNSEQTGFIAQDLYTIYPLAVSVGGDDPNKKPWAVDYGKLTPLLTKAIQELSLKVDNLEKENLTLQSENEQLKAKLSSVEDYGKRLAELEMQMQSFLKATGEGKEDTK